MGSVAASTIDEAANNLEKYILKFKELETQANSEQEQQEQITIEQRQRQHKQREKTPPKSLNDLPSPTGAFKRQTLTGVPIAKSHSSPIKPFKFGNLKPKSMIHQDSLSSFIEEISESDLIVYRSKLISEGRCNVCTLKNCQNHSQMPSMSQISSSNKFDSIVLRMRDQSDTTSIRESSREKSRVSRQFKPKENLYGSEQIESNLIKTSNALYPNNHHHRRRVRRPDSTLNDSFALKELSSQNFYDRDSETKSRDSEIKSRVLENQTVIGSFLSIKKDTMYNGQENVKLEDMDNKKLIQQLKLEDYHERKIMAQIQFLKDKKDGEILSKKENDIQEEKKKRYLDEQKKKLDEMRKIKQEEVRKEKADAEKMVKKEAKKKLQNDIYYKKIKQRVQAYKLQKEIEKIEQNYITMEEEQRAEEGKDTSFTIPTKQTLRPYDDSLSVAAKREEERRRAMEKKHEIIKAIYQPLQNQSVVAQRKISSNSIENYSASSFESLDEEKLEDEIIEESIEV